MRVICVKCFTLNEKTSMAKIDNLYSQSMQVFSKIRHLNLRVNRVNSLEKKLHDFWVIGRVTLSVHVICWDFC